MESALTICTRLVAMLGVCLTAADADAEVVRNGQQGIMRIAAAKKLEGSPTHPISHGGLCARGQAAIQVTYHPDRITQPLKRSGARGEGRYDAISWDDALAELLARLDALENPQLLAFLVRPGKSHRHTLIEEFLARYGAPPPIVFELFGDEVLRRANGLSFGREQLPTFDLPNTRYVLSFGADFLGAWNSPVAQSAGYGQMRQGRPGIRGTFVQVEARMSQTGASADEWVPVNPGTEGALALGIAQVIMAGKLRPTGVAGRAGTLIDGWTSGLTAYTPEEVEKITGVAARRIERLAREFAETQPAVAIVGGAPLAHTNGLFSALAVNALNALVGSVGQPGGLFFTPQIRLAPAPAAAAGRATPRTLDAVAADLLSGAASAPQVLLVDGANPVFMTPPAWRVRDALEKVPFIAGFGSFLDETSILADLILPDHSFLESWIDAVPESGATMAVASVAPPVMRPLHQTRATTDVLLEVGRRLRRPLNPPLTWRTFDEMLAATFASLPKLSADVETWTDTQAKGGWWGDLLARLAAPSRVTGGIPPLPAEPRFDGDAQQYPFHFLPYPSPAFLDGSLAHLPWLQEMPDPLTSAMWGSWVEINPTTAARAGIASRDLVEITSAHGTVRAAAVLSPGLAPNVIAMPVGQGHRTFTRYASGRGENPASLLAPITETATGALAWAATRVRIARVGDPDGRLILFAGGDRESPYEEMGRG